MTVLTGNSFDLLSKDNFLYASLQNNKYSIEQSQLTKEVCIGSFSYGDMLRMEKNHVL